MAQNNRNAKGDQGSPAKEKGQGSGQQTAGERGQKQDKRMKSITAAAIRKHRRETMEVTDKEPRHQ